MQSSSSVMMKATGARLAQQSASLVAVARSAAAVPRAMSQRAPARAMSTVPCAQQETFKSLLDNVPGVTVKHACVAVPAKPNPNAKMGALDGNEAAAHVAYAMSELSFIYPITPSTPMAEIMDVWASEKRKNVFGEIVDVTLMQSEGGASASVHGALVAGTLCSTFTCSQGLLLMIPVMYRIAGELNPCVFHVSARSVTSQGLCIFGDHSDVMACRQTGFSMLSAATVQETMDLALVSHLATLKTSVPFVHFFDGFRTSHEIAKIDILPYDLIKDMASAPDIAAGLQRHRDRALHPSHPTSRGSVQGPDVFFQCQETANPYYNAVPAAVQEIMDRFAAKTGRQYHLFDYTGHPEATHVVVVMGAGSSVMLEVADLLRESEDAKVGVLKVHLYRPWSIEHFLAALPASVKTICVLERHKEDSSAGEPLYRDVCTALQDAANVCLQKGQTPIGRDVQVIGGRFGLGSKEFTPAMALAVYRNLMSSAPKNHFTVGIEDDVTKLSLTVDGGKLSTVPKGTKECLFWGIGGDGTVGANKDAIAILGDNTPLNVQGYFFYDAHKTGGVTVSHLRFGPHPITAAYLIQAADYIACGVPNYLNKLDVVGPLKQGGVFVLNTSDKPELVEQWLPGNVKRELATKNAQFYCIDAYSVAASVGLGKRINLIMQTCFFALAKVLELEKALPLLKEAIARTYGNKGEKVVAANIAGVDKALSALTKVAVPESWKTAADSPKPELEAMPEFAEKVLQPLIHLEADKVPVSALPVGGWSPVGTSQFEKRNIARITPQWLPEKCTQCNYCSFVCPHAAIRPFLQPAGDEEAAKASGKLPKGYASVPLVSGPADLPNIQFSVQVSGSDCTGCGLCIQYCPADALETHKTSPKWIAEQDARFKYGKEQCPELGAKFDKFSVRGSQFQTPLLEFSGSCEGCGETPYVKLLTQLFGQRMMLANATGCSMVWSSTYGVVPYTTDKSGKGPAWGNSLFENNAEYGLGMHKAIQAKRRLLASNVKRVLASAKKGEVAISAPLLAALTEWSAKWNKEKADVVNPLCDTIVSLLAAEQDKVPALGDLYKLKDAFPILSTWIFGGDGWAYDIGYGGLDHVLASGEKVNILVLDNEMYSNTGGQKSKSTPLGAVVKFAASGNMRNKKDLGMLAMQYGDVYVASVALGANMTQLVRALQEAESYPGTSLVIAYVPCLMHSNSNYLTADREKIAVDSGYWTLYRFDPRLKAQGKSPFQLDSKKIKSDLQTFLQKDLRFRMVLKKAPIVAGQLKDFTIKRMQRLKMKEEYETAMVTGKSEASWNIKDEKAVLVLYGSETGNSEALANRMAAEATLRGVPSRAMAMDDFEFEELKEVKNTIVFCISTCGQGKVPANAEGFMKFLNSGELNADSLKGLRYSVFGLGDSKYAFFCKAAADLDKRMLALGAKRMVRRGVGNDADEDKFETGFEDWEPELWQSLALKPAPAPTTAPAAHFAVTVAPAGSTTLGTVLDRLVPPGARSLEVVVNKRMTPEDYNREIRHIELDLSAAKDIKYVVGDALAVWAHNDAASTEAVLDYFGLEAKQVIKVEAKDGAAPKPGLPHVCTAEQLFGQLLDINGRATRRFMGQLAVFASDAAEKEKLTQLKSDKAAFKAEVSSQGLSFLDVLTKFASVKAALTASLGHVIELLPVIKPRFYSIASSQKLNPHKLHLCVVQNTWTPAAGGAMKKGVCSAHLCGAVPAAGTKVRINAAISPAAIELPESWQSPMILCGLGTGIAPFRGLLQERAALLKAGTKLGPCVFYFGCRHKKQEFLYENELHEYLQSGVLTGLRTAFSHDQDHMIFVQHLMAEDAAEVTKLLYKEHGYFYFCGPAGKIPEEIKATIKKCVVETANISEDAANKHLVDMTIDGRYNVEAWG